MRKLFLIFGLMAFPLIMNGEPLNKITEPSKQTRQLNENFVDIDLNKQNVGFEVLATTPTVSDLRPGQIKLHKDAGVYHIYVRIGNDLIRFDGTKVN